MVSCKAFKTPMKVSTFFFELYGIPFVDPSCYRNLVGALQYHVLTRPVIAFSANKLCQFIHESTDVQLVATKKILHFLKGSLCYGITFSNSSTIALVVYFD